MIALGLEPASGPAKALVADVLPLVLAAMKLPRVPGKDRLATIERDLGAVLGGVLGPSLRSRVVRAQRNNSGTMWVGAAMGRGAFWRTVEALTAAALLGYKAGQKSPTEHIIGHMAAGKASALWGTHKLMMMATRHGITPETIRGDWRVSRAAETRAVKLSDAVLVSCSPMPAAKDQPPIPMAVTPDQQASAEAMREELRRLNAAIAAADVRGCPSVVLTRRFRHSYAFGGRLYAVGAGTYQTMKDSDRVSRLTIGGTPVCEVDVSAAQLSLFLALSGAPEPPPGDPYTTSDLPRAAVKAWVMQTFGTGRHVSRWGNDTPAAARAVKPAVVGAAVLAAYPALHDLTAIVPAALLDTLPPYKHGWAAGQFLVAREAEIISVAIGYCLAQGVAPLPVHDSLIVREDAEGVARRALEGAYWTLARLRVRLKVERRALAEAA